MQNKLILFLVISVLSSFQSFSQDTFVKVEGSKDLYVRRNVMIPAADGTLLATDIYRTGNEQGFGIEAQPLVLQRTPYGKQSDRFKRVIAHLASRGYIVAIQDLRGRYDSKGAFTKYSPMEASDGAATVEWLSKLSYVDGRIGMFGTSYGAHTQADASKKNPKGLSAMILNMGGMTNAWDHAVRQGGAFELGRELTWAFRQIPAETQDPVVKLHFEKEKINDWYSVWPFRKGLSPLSIVPNFEEYILEESTNSDYSEFWKKTGINWEEYYQQTADVPMVHIGGWYDIFLRGTIRNYVVLDSLQETPKWLILGPWTHSGNARTYAGDVDFGAAAAIPDFRASYQGAWFDYLFRGIIEEYLNTAPVQLFIMGGGDGAKNKEGRLNHGGHWENYQSWPPDGATPSSFYFHQDGTLSTTQPSQLEGKTTFTFDPEHPVPTLGGNVSARVKDGAFNQRERSDFYASKEPFLPLKSRSDILVFQTEPLAEDLKIVGPIEVELFVSSTAVDTDFTVKLIDVYPPSEDFPEGFDLNLTDAIVRMSYRNGRKSRELITPGETYKVLIEPFPTANLFKKGHRIRVDISSSNFPRWDINPNTGEPLGKHRRMIKADNTVYHSAALPSKIVLPIMPQKD